MTIDSAIEMCINQAIFQESHIGEWDRAFSKRCEKEAKEYRQLAEWLEELKDLREYKGKVEWVIKTHKQIKAETIDKCIEIVLNADVDILPSRDIILRDLEKLKEQNK